MLQRKVIDNHTDVVYIRFREKLKNTKAVFIKLHLEGLDG